jgi:hypothetical protein
MKSHNFKVSKTKNPPSTTSFVISEEKSAITGLKAVNNTVKQTIQVFAFR